MRALLLLAVLAGVTGCGSAHPAAAPTSTAPQFAPFSTRPPAALGSGLVCGVAADRLLGIADHASLTQFASGVGRPTSATIQEQLAAASDAREDRAAGLIVGQCEAYGFYMVTYQECLRPRVSNGTVALAAVRACIDRRRWTIYTQQ